MGLFRVTGDVLGNASGIATAVPFTPPCNLNVFTTAAVVNLQRPLV